MCSPGKVEKIRETQASVNMTNKKTKKQNRLPPLPQWANGTVQLGSRPYLRRLMPPEALLAEQELQQLVTSLTFLLLQC